MIILGINAYHGDSSACLLIDGKLIAAAEEERFRRIKHWAGFPSEAIRYCLKEGGITLAQVNHIAINRNPKANFWRKLGFSILNRPSPNLFLDRLRNIRKWTSIHEELAQNFPKEVFKGIVHYVEHHIAHLASAFLLSPFKEAVVISVDGSGDFASAAWAIGQDSKISLEGRIYFPHSLGIFYMAMTQYLGFPNWGDEYKLMGLAPYGQPNFMKEMRKIVLLKKDGTYRLDMRYFKHHRERLEEWPGCAPHVNCIYTSKLEELLGPGRNREEEITQRYRDIARSVQSMYEEAFFHLLTAIHGRARIDVLTLAGGCAMNSVANGKIYQFTPFKHAYIQAAPGDAGGALGAAYMVWFQQNGAKRDFVMRHAYWGPQFDKEHFTELIRIRCEEIKSQKCIIEEIGDAQKLCRHIAMMIVDGKIVGWFQGRMEWGPRALGNRSILCDPRRKDMKDILNYRIKRRESFRPFAPSILREAVYDWFEVDDDVPFMSKVFQIREEKRSLIPAVTHVDGSGRLQTVDRDTNPSYYGLIESFRGITGIPILLNTSFNENEPVVCRPEEALDCFLRTRMDVLVLGNFLIMRVV